MMKKVVIEVVIFLLIAAVAGNQLFFRKPLTYTSKVNGFSIILPRHMTVRYDKPGNFSAYDQAESAKRIIVIIKKNKDGNKASGEDFAVDYLGRYNRGPDSSGLLRKTTGKVKQYTDYVVTDGYECRITVAIYEQPDGFAALVVQCPKGMEDRFAISPVLKSFHLQ